MITKKWKKQSNPFPSLLLELTTLSQPLCQLLEEIAINDYEIKIINNEHIKIQKLHCLYYINIMKEFKTEAEKAGNEIPYILTEARKKL